MRNETDRGRFEEQGIEIRNVTAVGGISKKSEYVMQMMADVLGKEVAIVDADQTCALGAAIYAAVGKRRLRRCEPGQRPSGGKGDTQVVPRKERHDFYMKHYAEYIQLAEFGDNWKI